MHRKKHIRQDNIAYFFILPALILFTAFGLIPAILSFRMSFFKWDFLSPTMKFVGLDNYKKLFTDEAFYGVLKNTFLFTVITVALKVGLGVVIANFVATKVKGKVGSFIMESALFMPIVIPMSVVSLIFNKMFDTEFGILNGILNALNLGPIGWLTNENIALYSVMFVDVFKGIGFFFIVALVAIRNIPRQYYEAAELDGITLSKQFFKITLPLIGNTLVFLLITAFLSSFQVFDVIYIMLNGLFGDSKITISVMLYQQAFFYRNVGYSSAIAVVIFIFVMTVTLLQLYLSKKVVYNE